MRLIKELGGWFDQRLQLGKPIQETMAHPVPRRSASWAYVFGSGAFVVMMLQFATGICLAFVYVPSAAEAWTSLQVLNHQQTLGWFVRALHGWGSNFMVALVLIHMVQVFLFGAYKFPRELTWIVGVFLLLMTLGMAFTGQVLRFDQDAYWGLGIGASIMGRMPFIGTALVHSMLGGPIIAGETLSRFFAIHVFIVPGMLIAFVGVHLLMVLKLGVNEWPMPGRVVRRETYLKEYHEMTQKDGVPFVPDAFRKDFVFAGLIILALVACAAFFGPVWTEGATRSHRRASGAQAGLFFPVDVRGAGAFADEHGNAFAHFWTGHCHRLFDRVATNFRHRREKLAPPARRGFVRPAHHHRAGGVHPTGHLRAVVSGDGCMEQRACAGQIARRPFGSGAPGSGGPARETMPQLPRSGRRRRPARTRP